VPAGEMTMKTKKVNKDSYLNAGVLKATAAAVLALVATSASAGSLGDAMGGWLLQSSAAMQAGMANTSESGPPSTATLNGGAPFDVSSSAAGSDAGDDQAAPTSAASPCQSNVGSSACVDNPTDDAATTGLG